MSGQLHTLALYTQGKNLQYAFNKRLDVHQSQYGCFRGGGESLAPARNQTPENPDHSLAYIQTVQAPHNTYLAKVLWTNTLFNTISFTGPLRPWLVRHTSCLVSEVVTQWQCLLTHLHKPIFMSDMSEKQINTNGIQVFQISFNQTTFHMLKPEISLTAILMLILKSLFPKQTC